MFAPACRRRANATSSHVGEFSSKTPKPVAKGPAQFHLPGNVPATTALRVLLSASSLGSERKTMSEAMLFGIAGGIGAGVFAFRYQKEDFSSFFVAGRHLWHDDLAYIQTACNRLGVQVEVQETGGAKTAQRQLQDALRDSAPLIAWVDMGALPRRQNFAQCMLGGQYHVISIYGIDDASGQALIGDLADQPDQISLEALAQARAQIKKQKNRLLWLADAPDSIDWESAVTDGIKACHEGLVGRGPVKPPGGKSMASNFTLDAFRRWGERMHGSSGKDSWSNMFPRGVHLWRGLTSIYSFIQYGTGGGLTRSLYSQFFKEAHKLVGTAALKGLSEQYEQLGAGWDDLGDAALPDDVEMFRRFKELSVEKAEFTLSQTDRSTDKLAEIALEMADLERQAAKNFPLSASQCDALRAQLQEHIFALQHAESAAHQHLGTLSLR